MARQLASGSYEGLLPDGGIDTIHTSLPVGSE
jgi:hypothetical protein